MQKAKEERFFFKIDSPPLPSQLNLYQQRCVFINADIKIVNFTLFPTQTIRSLLCFHKDIHPTKIKAHSFVLLTVLDLQKCQLYDFPQGLTFLVHLWYLAISICYSSGFPKSICKLWSLQTLILHTYSRSMHLPREVQDL